MGIPIGSTDAEHRFWKRVEEAGDCWVWTGPNRQVSLKNRLHRVDRVAVFLVTGEWPPRRLHARRSCATELCVRPEHLSYPVKVTWNEQQRSATRDRAAQRALARSAAVVELRQRGFKACSDCHELLPLGRFNPNPRLHDGFAAHCKGCATARIRISRGVDPRDAYLRPSEEQRCEICHSDNGDKPLFFDHDHETGRFRGWLCHHCNTAVGHLRDDPALVDRAAQYLRSKPTNQQEDEIA